MLLKEVDRPRLAIFENLEILQVKTGYRLVITPCHDHVDHHCLRVGAKRGRGGLGVRSGRLSRQKQRRESEECR
jgi:hypothetical protein